MTIQEFVRQAVEIEGKKKQIQVAQAREIIRVVDKMTKGALYKIIRSL